MNLDLDDKVIVISGSSRGIGRGIAAILVEEGARVVITGRQKNYVKQTVGELEKQFPGQVLGHSGDLLEHTIIEGLRERVIGRWGCIDGVVANAGAVKQIPDLDIAREDWEWYLKYNFDVAVLFTQIALQDLINQDKLKFQITHRLNLKSLSQNQIETIIIMILHQDMFWRVETN